MAELEKTGIDIGGDTWVKIGCHRETSRLDRVLHIYQKRYYGANASLEMV